jgi:TatD DNase family protein
VGCHPHNASRYTAQVERVIIKAAAQSITGAIGEIGLDYHYDLSPRLVQQEVFKRQLELANEMLLPVVLHLREAHADGLRILQEQGMPLAGTLLHCFNLDFAALKPFLDLGCFVAFGGALTFKKADEVRDAARQAPLSRIMTETDAPFMAPHPVRGVICGPEHTVFTAAALVEAREVHGREAKQLLTQVYENARRFFDRDTSSWQDNPKMQEALYARAKGVESNV